LAGAHEAAGGAGLTSQHTEERGTDLRVVSLGHAMAGRAGIGHEQFLAPGGITVHGTARGSVVHGAMAGARRGGGQQGRHGKQAEGSDCGHERSRIRGAKSPGVMMKILTNPALLLPEDQQSSRAFPMTISPPDSRYSPATNIRAIAGTNGAASMRKHYRP